MISAKEFIEATKNQHILKAFGPQHLGRLAALAEEVDFYRDQVIVREGEYPRFFYLILEGSVGLEMKAGRHPMLLQTLQTGDALAWTSLIDGDKGAHFEARALTAGRAIAFDGAELRKACEADPAFGYHVMKGLLSLIIERLDLTQVQLVDAYATPV